MIRRVQKQKVCAMNARVLISTMTSTKESATLGYVEIAASNIYDRAGHAERLKQVRAQNLCVNTAVSLPSGSMRSSVPSAVHASTEGAIWIIVKGARCAQQQALWIARQRPRHQRNASHLD